MRNTLIKVGFVMLFGSMLPTLGYYFYCTQFSGKQIGKFSASDFAGAWTLSDGSLQSFPGGRATKPFSVDLDPAMNLVGFNWHGKVSGSGGKNNEYRAWLYFGGRPVMRESLNVSKGKKDSGTSRQWKSIGRFTVSQPGRYDFVLEEAGKPKLGVTNMQIEVRRNVVVPSTPILVFGGGLMVTGFALALIAAFCVTREGNIAAAVATIMLASVGLFFVLDHLMRDAPGSSSVAVQPARSALLPPAQPAAAQHQALPASVPQDTGAIEIQQAEPNPAGIGELITLRGTNFGHAENHSVAVGGQGMRVELEVVEWGQDVIRVRIPNDPRLKRGGYYYRVERIDGPYESSNLFMFLLEKQK